MGTFGPSSSSISSEEFTDNVITVDQCSSFVLQAGVCPENHNSYYYNSSVITTIIRDNLAISLLIKINNYQLLILIYQHVCII